MKNKILTLQSQHGFTLIEIIIGMVIICLLIGIVSTVSISTWRSQKYDFEKSVNIENERQIISYLNNEIRNATTINSPSAGNTTTSLLYQKNGDSADRTISLGSGSDINTILIKDPAGTVIKRLGKARIQMIQFQRDSTITKKITINLSLISLPGSNSPGNTISITIYTLN